MFTYHNFLESEREQIVDIINCVAAERKFLQTERYIPTAAWESVLAGERRGGQVLIVVKTQSAVAGFGRLFSGGQDERRAGNVGIVLLPEFRFQGAGTRLLDLMIAFADDYGYEILTADILADNFISLRLFRSHGFAEYSRRLLRLAHRSAAVEEIRMQLLLNERRGKNNVQLSNNRESD
ncbi:MAG: GNAT family N-acetyltransferase [Anaerolineales bacterium]|nr:GNAT family N-acetyltransferase [Anaerolineales bacterium]